MRHEKVSSTHKVAAGQLQITFALLLVPIMGATGLDNDYSKDSNDPSRLQNAADAAAATDHSLYGGRGGGKTDPDINTPVTFDLGDYTKRYLKMEIKNDGCDIGYKDKNAGTGSRYVDCVATTNSNYAKYNSTLTTDNTATVNHLFIDGVQLPAGSKPPLDDLMNCDNKPHSHAWEDGGGWAAQDFSTRSRPPASRSTARMSA